MATEHPSTDETSRDRQPIANKSKGVAIVLGILLSPLAYYYVGRTKLAVVNLLTLNYLMVGIVAVPIHVYAIISDAESAVDDTGASADDHGGTF
ncbi:TM2 domain-containing protein [Halapricum sp. CBA1109]|uniref:TM2 domain-containing protein n=1 Tax=Halapricum sp. CBA1109 TaxID=2668068 RepID=UPI0012FCDF26|nr:TM2 domain-containing protein [Halapricum sp. CBA1109]MUV90854.1 TM2 domain-containing protein [Halapricum sp. CBA1109]